MSRIVRSSLVAALGIQVATGAVTFLGAPGKASAATPEAEAERLAAKTGFPLDKTNHRSENWSWTTWPRNVLVGTEWFAQWELDCAPLAEAKLGRKTRCFAQEQAVGWPGGEPDSGPSWIAGGNADSVEQESTPDSTGFLFLTGTSA